MAPIYVKGGVWSNAEDEVLKAAIAKYGLNQWSRVSSLLSKKTAKQCKSRWNEWLNPTIKRLDWTKEEDEKILKLIKLRPNQWNSISIVMNRTANQCIERYQQLLDDNLGDSNLRLTGNVPGGVDALNLNPETKPARPDFEELDEDEKEMLSEAKARLANTQGKKAKRKARERLLAESRTVALLQKRRELKQVGINTKLKHKKKFKDEMDYNADIAFQRVPEQGVYDTTKEVEMNIRDNDKFGQKTDKFGTYNQEAQKQKKKEKKRKQDMERLNANDPSVQTQIQEQYRDDVGKRRKLVLSEPGSKETVSAVDIDSRIAEAAKSLNDRTFERSVLFTKATDDDDTESTESKNLGLQKVKVKKEKKSKKAKVITLAMKLKNLPKPLNDFEIIAEDINTEVTTLPKLKQVDGDSEDISLDKGELKRQELILKQELIDELRISQAKKLELPIPDSSAFDGLNTKPKNSIEKFVLEAMANLIKNDNEKGPGEYNLEELINESKIRKEIDLRVKAELEKTKLDDLEIEDLEDNDIKSDKLIEMLKTNTMISKSIESDFQENVSEKKKRSKQLLEDIKSQLVEAKEVELDYRRYLSLSEEEETVIRVRKQVLQDELSVLNETVEAAHRNLLF